MHFVAPQSSSKASRLPTETLPMKQNKARIGFGRACVFEMTGTYGAETLSVNKRLPGTLNCEPNVDYRLNGTYHTSRCSLVQSLTTRESQPQRHGFVGTTTRFRNLS